MFELISSDAANDLLIKVFNFREREVGQSTTQEAATLLSLFPGVRVREGFILDFSQEKTATGVNLPMSCVLAAPDLPVRSSREPQRHE
jgi:hypothetical protein